MIKKTGEVTSASSTELVAVNQSVEVNLQMENDSVPLNRPQMQQKVNTIIHEWLTDIWLLTTGEEMETDINGSIKHNGRPLAVVCDGQMKLMESKVTTLDALRSVGIEMS
jgi:NAD(P)H-dependent flavin oxidoreductase YrpB (nitropropane dioxygenase family)